MQIQVTFRNMESTQALKEYASAKLDKIRKYIDEPIKAEVVLKVEKFRHIAEITLNVNRSMINGTMETEDMYSAIDQAVDKVMRQVRKHKTKLKKHLSPNGHESHRNFDRERTVEEFEEEEAQGIDNT